MLKGVIILTFFLAACANGKSQDYLTMRDIPAPTEQNFIHCYNYIACVFDYTSCLKQRGYAFLRMRGRVVRLKFV